MSMAPDMPHVHNIPIVPSHPAEPAACHFLLRSVTIAGGQSARVSLARISSRGAATEAEAFTLRARSHAIKEELNIR